jgi:hypothetical protein
MAVRELPIVPEVQGARMRGAVSLDQRVTAPATRSVARTKPEIEVRAQIKQTKVETVAPAPTKAETVMRMQIATPTQIVTSIETPTSTKTSVPVTGRVRPIIGGALVEQLLQAPRLGL